jgi:hypothetical protein
MEGWRIMGIFLLLGVYASHAQGVSSLLHSDEWPLIYLVDSEPQDTIPASDRSSAIQQQTDTVIVDQGIDTVRVKKSRI